jgi:hypothetical protein
LNNYMQLAQSEIYLLAEEFCSTSGLVYTDKPASRTEFVPVVDELLARHRICWATSCRIILRRRRIRNIKRALTYLNNSDPLQWTPCSDTVDL